MANTEICVKICQFQTRSVLLKNLKAAAISKKPITTFTEFNQPPDLGMRAKYWGKRAKKKNGKAKAASGSVSLQCKEHLSLPLLFELVG